jgi:mRNA (guanine-N7-)-methyltransferase
LCNRYLLKGPFFRYRANFYQVLNHKGCHVAFTDAPQYTPPSEEECGPSDECFALNDDFSGNFNTTTTSAAAEVPLFQPPGSDDNLFLPPGEADFSNDYGISGYGVLDQATNGGWDNTPTNESNDTGIGGWTQITDNNDNSNNQSMTKGTFHANEGAAAADVFYSGLTRSLDTRADSRLYHM